MCELTDKLRSYNPTSGYSSVMRQAADEIDRLRIEKHNILLDSIIEESKNDPAVLEYFRPQLEKLAELLGVA